MGKSFSNYRKSVINSGMGGGMPNMQQLMEQAKAMQQELEDAKSKIAEASFTGSSGGGLVKVTVTGEKIATAISIDKNAVDPDDVEMLEDLVLAALNDAYSQADEYVKQTVPEGAEGLI